MQKINIAAVQQNQRVKKSLKLNLPLNSAAWKSLSLARRGRGWLLINRKIAVSIFYGRVERAIFVQDIVRVGQERLVVLRNASSVELSVSALSVSRGNRRVVNKTGPKHDRTKCASLQSNAISHAKQQPCRLIKDRANLPISRNIQQFASKHFFFSFISLLRCPSIQS